MKKITIILLFLLLIGCSTNEGDKPLVPNTTTTTQSSTNTTTKIVTIKNKNMPYQHNNCKVNLDENAYVIAYDKNLEGTQYFKQYAPNIVIKSTCINELELPKVTVDESLFYHNGGSTTGKFSIEYRLGVYESTITMEFDYETKIQLVGTVIVYNDIKELYKIYPNINPENIISKELIEKDEALKQKQLKEKGLDGDIANYIIKLGFQELNPDLHFNNKQPSDLEVLTKKQKTRIILNKLLYSDNNSENYPTIGNDINNNIIRALPEEIFYKEYEKFFGDRNVDLNKINPVYSYIYFDSWEYDSLKKQLTYTLCKTCKNDYFIPYVIDNIEKIDNIYYLTVGIFSSSSGVTIYNQRFGLSDFFERVPLELNYVNTIGQVNKKNYLNNSDDITKTYELNKEKFYKIRYSLKQLENGELVFNDIKVISPTK